VGVAFNYAPPNTVYVISGGRGEAVLTASHSTDTDKPKKHNSLQNVKKN